MPGHPDPRLNLGLTLDRAGQEDGALQEYTAALEVYPGFLPAIQGLARLAVATGREEPRLLGWLETIALEGETEEWRRWARSRLE
jgi:Tfp pilus assembly protein PilF